VIPLADPNEPELSRGLNRLGKLIEIGCAIFDDIYEPRRAVLLGRTPA
jgi:hypothetical protein